LNPSQKKIIKLKIKTICSKNIIKISPHIDQNSTVVSKLILELDPQMAFMEIKRKLIMQQKRL
jgi:hypothetical protein